jgi:sugar phosphate isomerase/epimerase
MQLMVFSKHLTPMPLQEAARSLCAMGISSIDLTVRPGGHVEPTRVEDDLPVVSEVLAGEGVSIGMISTGIIDASLAENERVLRVAAGLGIKFFKLGYFSYQGFGSLRRARDEAAMRLRDVAALASEVGIQGGFHNHSDRFLGASLWDIDFILQKVESQAVGLYFDPAHAVVEGGSAGWEMGLDLLQERVVMLALKDYRWVDVGHGYAGARRHAVQFCPFLEGNVPWAKVWKHLHSVGFNGPVSFHSEYQGAHAFRDLTSVQVLEQTSQDLEFMLPFIENKF